MNIPEIKLLALDVDGVLTDGKIILDNNGVEFKAFCAHDGMGIKAALKAGLIVALITSRSSNAVKIRATELGITEIYLGCEDKFSALSELIEKYTIDLSQVCYVGDDLVDLSVLTRVGWAVTVPQACNEVKQYSHYITNRSCGEGAVREIIEMILKQNGDWERLIQYYTGNDTLC